MQLELFDVHEFSEERWRNEQEQRAQRIRERLAHHRHRIDVLHRKLEMIKADLKVI